MVYRGLILALIELGNPELLLLIPLLITLTLIGHYFAHRMKRSLEVFHYPSVRRLSKVVVKKGLQRSSWRGLSLGLKLVIILLITFSLSSPTVLTFSEITNTVEVPMATDKDVAGQIILAIDSSGSMSLKDVSPSRLEAAKTILKEFVQNSSTTVQFGVVVFEREIAEVLPITGDRSKLVSTIENVVPAEQSPCLEEFTDIGTGLQTAIDLLTPFSPYNKSSAIILLSDGFANYGYPNAFASVSAATDRAEKLKLPIHALHIARMGQDSNEQLMRQIADETNAKFMESTDIEELRKVLDVISKYYVPTHEWSSKVEVKTTVPSKTDLGLIFMCAAAALVLALWVGNYKHYKTSF